MARKTASRMELRKQAEAASKGASTDGKSAKKKKKATRKKTSRAKAKTTERKRLVWAVINGSMKEEARFPYDQRDAAEEKITQLKAKSPKKLFYIQRVKEPIPDAPPPSEEGK